MTLIHSPHDKYFKEAFGDVAVVQDFVKHYLSEEILGIIKVTTLKPLKESFIQEKMQEYFVDLLFEVQFGEQKGYLYFLFEHKSYKDPLFAVQLLRYMTEIWAQGGKKEQVERLPIILPIVFYHGKQKWKRPKTIANWVGDMQEIPPTLGKFVPNYEFLFYDFSKHGDEIVMGGAKLRAYLEMVRHIHSEDPDVLLYAFVKVYDMLQDDPSFVRTTILYFFGAQDKVSVEEAKERLPVEGRKRLMSIAEQLRQEGKKEGRRENALEIARELLQLNMPEEEIIRVTKISREELETIKQGH